MPGLLTLAQTARTLLASVGCLSGSEEIILTPPCWAPIVPKEYDRAALAKCLSVAVALLPCYCSCFSVSPKESCGDEVSLPGSPDPGDHLPIPAASSASPGLRPEIQPSCSWPFPINILC